MTNEWNEQLIPELKMIEYPFILIENQQQWETFIKSIKPMYKHNPDENYKAPYDFPLLCRHDWYSNIIQWITYRTTLLQPYDELK